MQSVKIWTAFLIPLLFFLIPNSPVFAAFSLSISSINPDSVTNSGQEVTVNVSINGLPSESYFRIGWQESSGKPYFGYMKNINDDWVKVESSQDCKNYYKISDLTTTSLAIITKIGEENTVNNGSYLLKARRYTATCLSYTDSDSVSIQVNFFTPTPSSAPTYTATIIPTQIPTNSPTPKNTPTLTKVPTPTPTTKPTQTPKTPTPTKIPTPTPIKSGPTAAPILIASDVQESTQEALPTSILGESTESAANTVSPPPEKETKAFESSSGNLSKILIGIGVIFLIACGILALRSYIKSRKENENIYHK